MSDIPAPLHAYADPATKAAMQMAEKLIAARDSLPLLDDQREVANVAIEESYRAGLILGLTASSRLVVMDLLHCTAWAHTIWLTPPKPSPQNSAQ